MKLCAYISFLFVILANISNAMVSVESVQRGNVPMLRLVSPISEDDNQLSPRSMYFKGAQLISQTSKEDKIYGAWLILQSARNGSGEGISHFNLSCNIQDIDSISDYELLETLLSVAS